MLKFVLLLGFFVFVTAGKSPNGEDYFSRFTPEELQRFHPEIVEDALLDVPGLIQKYGYPAESHEVETEDGYLITMHRIPHGVNGKKSNGIPVLLMHGLMGSSSNWVFNRPEWSLGYMLADEGYDVWMGNARGNFYSRKHVTLDPETRRFWRFSWHEIGFYDLPAMIDYILEENGNDKLHYVGHSQGTTSFFVMGSSRPAYNDKIITMHAFAPVAYMSNLSNQGVRALAKYASSLQVIITILGLNEFLPHREIYFDLAFKHCTDSESPLYELCTSLVVDGADSQTNTTMIPVWMGHSPSGASSRQFVHYGQLHVNGLFRQYDHGSFANIAAYGRLTPPRYPLERITAPVALHYSLADDLADPGDVYQLAGEIANPIGLFRVPLDTFTHLNFITAIDIKDLLYYKVLDIMKSHDGTQ